MTILSIGNSEHAKKHIRVGFIQYTNKDILSPVVITGNFLRYFSKYVTLEIIPIEQKEKIEETFRTLETYQLDYLYVDAWTFLLQSFLIREKFNLNIPLIVKLHTIFPWAFLYSHMIPFVRNTDIIYAPCDYAKKAFGRISTKTKVHLMYNFVDYDFIKNIASATPPKKNANHNLYGTSC